MRIPLKLLAAGLAVVPLCARAQVTFEEYNGVYGDNAQIPVDSPPWGLPDPITATWTGFQLHTRSADTPMSIFTSADLAGDDAIIRFSGPVMLTSMNAYANGGGSPLVIIGRRWSREIWRYTPAAQNNAWSKVTTGAGKEIDAIAFEGRWNHFDDILLELAPDSDGDGYTDGDETATGHDPNDPNNNPAAQAIANSETEWTTTGIQGENDWYNGWRNVSADGGGDNYDPATKFIEFTPEQWNGGGYALGGNPPWTTMGPVDLHPNGVNNGAEHWVIRRWVANKISQVTPLAIRWHVNHQNVACGGNGVTGLLLRNGQVLEKLPIAAPDGVGATHTFYINANPGDRIDVALSPRGPDNNPADGCDGSRTSFLVDPTIPADPRQPDGSIFVPAGSGDTDGDGLADLWEESFFPNDLTKLSRTGDFDQDGATDLQEFERDSDPTKGDTDGDGLGDAVETKTGVWVSATNTGTDPRKTDTDGDGLGDFAEATRVPPTDPNKADSDVDTFSDAAEIAAGSDPLSAADTPMTYILADSQAQFSGVQGQQHWYSGYRIYDPVAAVVDYNPNQDFIPFPGGSASGDPWDGVGQTWVGSSWDLNTDAAAPWTTMGRLDVHPNGANSAPEIGGVANPNNEQWPIRRWVASALTSNTPVSLVWTVKKTNLNNDGVTGYVFVNGKMVDSKAIEGNDGQGVTRRYSTVIKPNDIVDLALSPAGPNGRREDWSDGSQNTLLVDARPVPVVTEITLKEPVLDAVQGKFTMKWASQAGAKYVVWSSGNPATGWTQLQTVDSGGTETTFTDTLPTPQPAARFYRVSKQ